MQAEDLRARAARIRLLLFDVDGVMTDGSILLDATGAETKRFDVRDGTAIVLAHRAGLCTGVLSGRASAATQVRAAQLGMTTVHEGVADKLAVYERILRAQALTDEDVAYMGDDLQDLPVLARVGLSAAPADAAPDVQTRVHWLSRRPGGHGAVRELVELVLRVQGRWDEMVRHHCGEDDR